MPTRTLTISQRTLPLGQTVLGPMNVGNNTAADIHVDRTIAGGLDSLTTATTVDVLIQTSPDGTTWKDLGGATWGGGIYSNPNRGPLTASFVSTGDVDPAVSRVRVITTVGGPSPVVVAGTVTVT